MTTALYRRYRPETFQDVIGQSHVTDPLMTALRKNKVNHAYLFSGPRGCGKTTSARILARCLNCVEGPTPNPCGRCESCMDLSRDGAGSLDVIEMDAASHGGVDDARQLRERATFAPVRDRYKIFIIDEAHMVTRDGFNALLKIVEEPPEHIKFIFATTEPNKVLATIRSRTHHYPFRLVPPEPLMDYLQQLCDQESVGVEPGVLAMVVRAGGGSVRDSLSVLDQLMAGTDTTDIGYDLAVSLLGYTHGALLDDVVDAFASGDAATVFRAVDRVIQTGQDPRRFVEDLLERFRDLVIVDAVPESAANILHGMPEDQVARLRNQAQLMGPSELSRAADITNEALTEMTGATSPQLHLELLCARLLLPSAESTSRGAGARIDRLERRLNMGRTGAPTGPLVDVPAASGREAATPAGPETETSTRAPQTSTMRSEPRQEREPLQTPPRPTRTESSEPQETHRESTPEQTMEAPRDGSPRGRRQSPEQPQQPTERGTAPAASSVPDAADLTAPDPTTDTDAAADSSSPPRADAGSAQGPSSGGGIDMIRASWTEVVNALADIHRVSWMTVMRGTPVAFDGSVLQLVFDAEGDRKNFPRFEPNLVDAIQQVLGVSCRVEAVGPGGGGGSQHRPSPGPTGGADTGRGPGSSRDRGPAGIGQRRGPNHPADTRAGGPPRNSTAAAGNNTGPRTGTAPAESRHEPSPSSSDNASDDDAPVDSWAVATIPSGDSPGPVEDDATDGHATDRPNGGQGAAPGSSNQTGGTRTGTETPEAESPPGTDSAPESPTSESPTTESPTTGHTVSGGTASPSPRGTAVPQRSERPGQGPSPTPAAPDDDIPWPDDPPPEDEPPVEDTYGQGRPSRGGNPTQGGAPTPSASPVEREVPPEQWRPSARPAASAGQAHPQQATSTSPGATTTEPPSQKQRKPSFRERHAAQIAAAQADSGRGVATVAPEPGTEEEFVPSDDDVAVESSGLQGRAMIEKILGGRLVEERPHEPRL